MRGLVVLGVVALALAGCSSDESAPRTEPDTEPSSSSPSDSAPVEEPAEGADEVTFESLGIDWPTEFTPLDQAPEPPAQIDAATYDAITEAIIGFAEVSALTPSLRVGRDLPDRVAAQVDEPFRSVLPQAFEQTVAPRLAVVNYFDKRVDVLGQPRVQYAWKVGPDPDRDGVRIQLQQWVAYEVRQADGPTRVVGVFREFYRTEATSGATGWSWQEAGADSCGLAVDDVLRPGTEKSELTSLEKFVRQGARARPVDFTSTNRTDEATRQECLDGAA